MFPALYLTEAKAMFLFHAKSVIPENRIVPTIGRKKLDLQPIKSIFALVETICQKAIAALMDDFMADVTKEPELKIWQKRDRDGRIDWYARNPLTGKTIAFASETEMLKWIEHQNHPDRW
jgi:hypothetical protein